MPIEFDVTGAGTSYIDLSQSQLVVRVQLLKGNGSAIDNTFHVAPCNLFLHSLFSEIDVKLNGTLITSSNNTYPYRAYIETLLSYGHDAKSSQLTSALYYKDQGGDTGFEEGDPHNAVATNKGMVKRNSFYKLEKLYLCKDRFISISCFKIVIYLQMLGYSFDLYDQKMHSA